MHEMDPPRPEKVIRLEDMVEQDALEGDEPFVTPRMLARRWGGSEQQVRLHLDFLVRQGRLKRRVKIPRNGRKSLPYTIYFRPRESD